VQQVTNIVLSVAKRLVPATVSLHNVLWAILAEEVIAPEPLPPFPTSIKVYYGDLWIQHFSFTIPHVHFDLLFKLGISCFRS
jgi:hypothetical protein